MRFLLPALVFAFSATFLGLPAQEPGRAPRKRPPGEPALFRELLSRHARLRLAKDRKGAQKVAALFGRFDWSGLPLPYLTHQTVTAWQREPGSRAMARAECLPKQISTLTHARFWVRFATDAVAQAMENRRKVGAKKTPISRRPRDRVHDARALVAVLDRVLEDLGPKLVKEATKTTTRFREAVHPAYQGFQARTARKTTGFAFLPPGPFLRHGALLGDERAWAISRAIVRDPRSRPENLEDAVMALLDLDATRLPPSVSIERSRLLAKLLDGKAELPTGLRERVREFLGR